jgi:hypothetical protein
MRFFSPLAVERLFPDVQGTFRGADDILFLTKIKRCPQKLREAIFGNLGHRNFQHPLRAPTWGGLGNAEPD